MIVEPKERAAANKYQHPIHSTEPKITQDASKEAGLEVSLSRVYI